VKIRFSISSLALTLLFPLILFGRANGNIVRFDFYGNAVEFEFDSSNRVDFAGPLSTESILKFYKGILNTNYSPIVEALNGYKSQYHPNDWLFYQLIRRTAQQISPKAENYNRYTLYKWFLLSKSGYDATLAISSNQLLFYVQCDENIYNIPYRIRDGKQYVCLNYHDFGFIDFEKTKFTEIAIQNPGVKKPFSYKVTQLPDFDKEEYEERDLSFNYYNTNYHFKIKLNPQVKTIFANYPVVDYESYFNIPLSKETYSSSHPCPQEECKTHEYQKRGRLPHAVYPLCIPV
jgi:hypothetical protein